VTFCERAQIKMQRYKGEFIVGTPTLHSFLLNLDFMFNALLIVLSKEALIEFFLSLFDIGKVNCYMSTLLS
jgi:hypothetical protein